MLLKEFKTTFKNKVLDLLWQQWTGLGVSGYGEQWDKSPIDPEALLLLTCSVGRYDARLFDGMVEWLTLHERYISVQRLKRIMKTEGFVGEHVLQAVAAKVMNPVSASKWAGIVKSEKNSDEAEALFYQKNGHPLPIVNNPDPVFAEQGYLRDVFTFRGIATPFRPENPVNLLLRLRAFFGVNARCEVLLYLLLNERGSPGSMARETYFFPLTVSKVMAEMRDSGYLSARKEGRRLDHRLVPELWKTLFIEDAALQWIVWPKIFRSFEALFLFLDNDQLFKEEPLAQASALRRVMKESVVDNLETCGLPFTFGDMTAYPGEQILPFVIERMEGMLRAI